MIRRDFIKTVGVGLTAACFGIKPALAVPAKRPNIIVILSDDVGYSDIGCYGSEIQTPTLNGLASQGLRFRQFFNTARCCPTRASLMTGLNPHQAGIGWMMTDEGYEGYRGDLNKRCVTIAEALKPAGYSTYMLGKWHLTPHPTSYPVAKEKKYNWPLQRGFERYYGIINGASSLWDPNSLVRDNQPITIKNDPVYQPQEDYHFTDALSDNAVQFIDEHDTDNPFFMYVAYTSAHWPMHARERDIAKYKGSYDVGYDTIRKARFKRMKELGVIRPDTELSPTVGDWDKIKDKRWESACMEVYAAMLDQMDQGIGRIVKKLKEKGQLEDTLIFYLQDNGGCAESGGRSNKLKPRADKPSLLPIPDDVIHYTGSCPQQTRDGWPVRRGKVMPGPADTYIGYGKNWANVSNTPFREYKHWVHEGGISTPLVVHWPNGFSGRNEIRDEPSHLIDIMATCLDIAGGTYPKTHAGQGIKPLEGMSLVPVFQGRSLDREALYWEHEGNRAVRWGNWKLVAKSNKRPWELYDIKNDRSELHDLSKEQPQRVKELEAMWMAYAKRCDALKDGQVSLKAKWKPKQR